MASGYGIRHTAAQFTLKTRSALGRERLTVEFPWRRLYFFAAPLSRASVGANRPGSWHDMHE